MQCPILLTESHGPGPGGPGVRTHTVEYRCVHEQGQGHIGPHLWARDGHLKGTEADRCH